MCLLVAVIASDGVFEFITSQAVVDMIEKFTDKLAAAKHVVAEAYRLWLTYDDRTDDISIIILVFENMKLNPNASPSAGQRTHSVHTEVQESKPVRKMMSKAKRKDIAENWNKDDVVEIDFDKIVDNKVSLYSVNGLENVFAHSGFVNCGRGRGGYRLRKKLLVFLTC
jgi:hypothetical protein